VIAVPRELSPDSVPKLVAAKTIELTRLDVEVSCPNPTEDRGIAVDNPASPDSVPVATAEMLMGKTASPEPVSVPAATKGMPVVIEEVDVTVPVPAAIRLAPALLSVAIAANEWLMLVVDLSW